MQPGDIVLFYSKGLWGKIVDRLTNGMYYHCEIMFTDNFSLKVYERGIAVSLIKEENIGKEYDIYSPTYSSRTNRVRAVKHAQRIAYQTPRYGFLNLMMFVFIKLLRKLKVRWFEGDKFITCSEMVADCLEAGGIRKYMRLRQIPNSLLSPNDLPRVFNMFLDSGII